MLDVSFHCTITGCISTNIVTDFRCFCSQFYRYVLLLRFSHSLKVEFAGLVCGIFYSCVKRRKGLATELYRTYGPELALSLTSSLPTSSSSCLVLEDGTRVQCGGKATTKGIEKERKMVRETPRRRRGCERWDAKIVLSNLD